MSLSIKQILKKYSGVFITGTAQSNAPKVLRQRRDAELQNLKSLWLCAGVEKLPGSENLWHSSGDRQIQEPALIWLTGLNQTGIRLILNPFSKDKSQQVHLFLPEQDPKKEFWEGTMACISKDPERKAEIQSLTGIESIHSICDWENVLLKLVKTHKLKSCIVHNHDYRKQIPKGKFVKTDHNYLFRRSQEKFFKKHMNGFKIDSDPIGHLHRRSILDKWQISDSKKAQEITKDAFLSTLGHLKQFKSERDLSAFLDCQMLKETSFGLAFPTICASGANAGILHYQKKDEPLIKEGLVLLDFGARYGSMHADISRTLPVSGRFNPLQLLLYQIVLDTQKFHQNQVKPGRLLKDLDQKAWEFLNQLLAERFLSQGGEMHCKYESKPHGISHLIGEQIHEGDPFRYYQSEPLKPGMLISNEPGLYGHFKMKINGKYYNEKIGIRLEDDLLITQSGCVNLSANLPKDPLTIETLIVQK
jgi:Xaa-Pro aminopeptidase